jgi:hypothetical protein
VFWWVDGVGWCHVAAEEEEASFSRTLGKGIQRLKNLAAAALGAWCIVSMFPSPVSPVTGFR